MDRFCIDRGTLLDDPSRITLEEPNEHSVHCLIEVPSCYTSEFEVLIDPGTNSMCPFSDMYSRGFTLDDNGRSMVIELAREIGICPRDCVGEQIEFGFRATIFGEVQEGSGSESVPPTMIVSRVEESSVGCSGEGVVQAELKSCLTSAGGMRMVILLHAGFMVVSWGIVLPLGVAIARFLKHYPDGLWFKLHRGIQIGGLTVAVIGWAIALANFNVFGDVGMRNYYHGILGMIVMILGILQPINAFVRPHNPEEGQSKSQLRRAWEILHKTSGYVAVLLAAFTIILGTFLLPSTADQITFQAVYGVVVVILVVSIVLLAKEASDRRKTSQV